MSSGPEEKQTFVTQAPLDTYDTTSQSMTETVRNESFSSSLTLDDDGTVQSEEPLIDEPTTVDRYEVLDVLGEGGMGSRSSSTDHHCGAGGPLGGGRADRGAPAPSASSSP